MGCGFLCIIPTRSGFMLKNCSKIFLGICLSLSLVLSSAAGALAGQPAVEPQTLALIQKLATKPELMHIGYLQYLIGLPENWRSQRALSKKTYFWYQEPRRHVAYQLDQNGPLSGSVTASNFTINVPNSQITFKDVEKLFGTGHRETFDHRAYPTRVIAVSPTTHIAFIQPHDSFRVNHIVIGYQGPPLPPPSRDDVELAYNFRKAEALMACQNGRGEMGIPFLQADLARQPDNARLHLQLAQAYKSHLMLNEAISSYNKAMRLSGGDPAVVAACQAGLVELKVLPASTLKNQGRRSYLAGNQSDGLGL